MNKLRLRLNVVTLDTGHGKPETVKVLPLVLHW